MRRCIKINLLTLTAVIIFLLGAGLSSWSFFRARYKQPTTTQVIISRNNTLNQPGISNFSVAVNGSTAVNLLNDIHSLKAVPGGPGKAYNCPLDAGVYYRLVFTNPHLVVIAAATGCQWVAFNDQSYYSTAKFWNDIDQATGHLIYP